MKLRQLGLVTAILTSLILTGCNKDKGDKGDKSEIVATQIAPFSWEPLKAPNAQIKIVNRFGEAVVGAQILIGDAQGSPFRDNFLTTDRNGQVVVPSTWTTPAAITVAAAGYIRQSILNQTPGNITIRVNTAYMSSYPEVKGNVTDLPVVNKDKLVDFALAMPLLTRQDLLTNFSLDQVISPYMDNFSAAGQKMTVPSNVSLPTQKENYSIISVTLDKPIYRIKTPTVGPKKFVAIRGRFVFKTVVDAFRSGKSFADLINEFTIIAGGIKDGVVTSPLTNLDLPGNDIQFTSQVKVNASAPQSDEVALVLAGSDIDGFLMPTDVKRVTPGQATNLQTVPNRPTQIVNFIKKQSEFMSTAPGSDRMSASMLPYSAADQYKLLPLMSNPQITNQGRYVITAQALKADNGINPVATTAVISDLIQTREGGETVTTPARRWEVFSYGWQPQMVLPQWPLEAAPAKGRVEVKYIGSSTSSAVNTLDFATHVTHASTDF